MENHRRIIEVANITEEQGLGVIVSANVPQRIDPLESQRVGQEPRCLDLLGDRRNQRPI